VSFTGMPDGAVARHEKKPLRASGSADLIGSVAISSERCPCGRDVLPSRERDHAAFCNGAA